MIKKLTENCKLKIVNSRKGFTLIELLAVLGVVVVVGTVASAIILSSLRAATKANQVNLVRQNGNFAILQTSRTIQYAKSFDGVSSTYDGVDPQNDNFSNDCTSTSSPQPSPSGAPATARYSAIKVTLFDESQVTFACTPPAVPFTISEKIGSETTDLIDTNSISIVECYFTCSQNFKTDSPAIGINLILSQSSSGNFAEKTALIPFTTTITMRNPNK